MSNQKKTTALSKQEECVSLASPKALLDFSTNIKSIIVENKLFTPIERWDSKKKCNTVKNYINVDGWQIVGAFTGMYPIIKDVKDMSTENEIIYQAKVNIYSNDSEGKAHLESTGIALCSNHERGKERFDRYAVQSMAQTRAIGKAYRNRIGYLLKMAGYETTPYEEIEPVIKSNNNKLVYENVKPEPIKAVIVEEQPSVEKPQTKSKTPKEKELDRLKNNCQAANKLGMSNIEIQCICNGVVNKPSKKMTKAELEKVNTELEKVIKAFNNQDDAVPFDDSTQQVPKETKENIEKEVKVFNSQDAAQFNNNIPEDVKAIYAGKQ